MTSSTQVALKPGDTVGILGGGQLGRMLALAAARLGLKSHVFSPDPDSPAFDVVQHCTCAEYADIEALELFASDVDVITYEFENVPTAAAMALQARRPVLPDTKILETTMFMGRKQRVLATHLGFRDVRGSVMIYAQGMEREEFARLLAGLTRTAAR